MQDTYSRDGDAADPPYLAPDYLSTRVRAPKQPLIVIPQTLSEITGPVYGQSDVKPEEADLTTQHAGEPQGERIVVTGRVLDERGRPVPNTLVEIWQCNAAGRYIHEVDQHPAPLDPNFTGAGRTVTDADGHLSVHHRQARRLSLAQPRQRLAARAHPLLAVWPIVPDAARDADVLPWRSAVLPGPDLQRGERRTARERMVCRFDLEATKPEWALGYAWDIELARQQRHARGRRPCLSARRPRPSARTCTSS